LLIEEKSNATAFPATRWPNPNLAPQPLPATLAAENAPLPQADAVVILWDRATRQAFESTFQATEWIPYARDCMPSIHEVELHHKLTIPAPEQNWGHYAMARIGDKQILLLQVNPYLQMAPPFAHYRKLYPRLSEECKMSLLLSLLTDAASEPSQVLGDVVTTLPGNYLSELEPLLLQVEDQVWPAPPGYRAVPNQDAQAPQRPRIHWRPEPLDWTPQNDVLTGFAGQNPAVGVGCIQHLSSLVCNPQLPLPLQQAWALTSSRHNSPQTAYNAALATWAVLTKWMEAKR